LLIVIENEKTSAIIFIREFLNNGTDIPKFLHFNLLPKIDTREKPQTTHGIHTEFRNPFPPNNNNRQSYQANYISLNFPVPARPAQHVLSDSTDAPSTNLLQNNTPLNVITLDRKKQNIVTPLFAYLTGLAPKEDIDILNSNEQKILQSEQQLTDRIQQIQSQTANIVDSIKEQNSKVSQLYKDEITVKQTIQSLLQDTDNAVQQLSSLTAALEIYSDVSSEFQGFLTLLNLVPYLVTELKDTVQAITTQTIAESLIPSQEISLKIPNNKRASLLAVEITPFIQANEFLVQMEIPEFLPVFTLYYIKTVPFITVPNQTLYQMHQVINYTPYQILNPETNLIAVNIDHETFVYKEGICNDQKSITICPNQMKKVQNFALRK
jgi:hypothetical protein